MNQRRLVCVCLVICLFLIWVAVKRLLIRGDLWGRPALEISVSRNIRNSAKLIKEQAAGFVGMNFLPSHCTPNLEELILICQLQYISDFIYLVNVFHRSWLAILVLFMVNLSETRVTWEEGTSDEELLSSDWYIYVAVSPIMISMGLVHRRQCQPGQVVLGCVRKAS